MVRSKTAGSSSWFGGEYCSGPGIPNRCTWGPSRSMRASEWGDPLALWRFWLILYSIGPFQNRSVDHTERPCTFYQDFLARPQFPWFQGKDIWCTAYGSSHVGSSQCRSNRMVLPHIQLETPNPCGVVWKLKNANPLLHQSHRNCLCSSQSI